MKKALLRAGGMLLAMTVLCGFGYTFAVTGLGQLLFPHQAGGCLLYTSPAIPNGAIRCA